MGARCFEISHILKCFGKIDSSLFSPSSSRPVWLAASLTVEAKKGFMSFSVNARSFSELEGMGCCSRVGHAGLYLSLIHI